MLKISIRKLVISLLFASASFVVTAADVTIETAASVLTMKHPGFTLLKDSGGTEYTFGVYETPGGEGDVFLFGWTENSDYKWEVAPWTNITQNSARTYPNHADDVAMVLYTGTVYKFLTIPSSGVTIGQLVIGMTYHWTLDHTSGTVTPLFFERTDGTVPRICLSRPASSGGDDLQFRLGNYDQDNGGNVLDLSFVGDALEVDWCGDTAAAAAYARVGAISFAFGRGRILVGAGQSLSFLGGSRLTKNVDNVSLFKRENARVLLVLNHPDAKKIPVSKSYYKTIAERLGRIAS